MRYPYHDVAYNSQMSRIQENGSTDVQGSGSSYQNEDVEYNNRLRDILGGQNMDQRNMGQQVHYPSNNTNQVRQNPIPTMTDRRNDRNPISNYGAYARQVRFQENRRQTGNSVNVGRGNEQIRSDEVNLCGGNIYIMVQVGEMLILAAPQT